MHLEFHLGVFKGSYGPIFNSQSYHDRQMDNSSQRAYVKTRFLLGDNAEAIHFQLLTTQGTSSVSLRTVRRWLKALADGNFTTQKGITLGRPLETTSAENIALVKKLVKKNPRTSVREIAGDLSLSRSTVHRILTVHLDLRTVLSVWVPHNLSPANKIARVECAEELLDMFRSHSMEFIASRYLVEDESWVSWDCQDQRRVWIGKKDPKPTLPRVKLTKRKTMVLVAFKCRPKRYSLTLLPQGATVDSTFTTQFLDDTKRRFIQLTTHPIQFKDMLLQCDNARPHASNDTTEHLVKMGVKRIKQSPYSPDVNLCDRHLFRKLKSGLTNTPLHGPDDVKSVKRSSMDHIPETELVRELEKLRDHCNEVVRLAGEYPFEI